jgi:hypothetical protein
MPNYASARPTKRFFIQMLTADIALEDAILDLIDNSVDGIVRANNFRLDESLLRAGAGTRKKGHIDVNISDEEICITDNGIGIARKEAEHDVFRLGRVRSTSGNTLGVYGIGLKRALFKLGNAFEVTSRVKNERGFRASLQGVDVWQRHDPDKALKGEDPWGIPLEDHSRKTIGTDVRITEIRPEIRMRLRDRTTVAEIRRRVGTTYCLMLEKYLTIKINGELVPPQEIPIGRSRQLKAAVKHIANIQGGKVKATIVAGIADGNNQRTESAGWYILCNGRVIVNADRTSMTGWGVDGFPLYVQSFRAFIGIVFFFSDFPDLLPWQTTKRGINPDSVAYIAVKDSMRAVAKPITTYLRTLYYKDDEEALEQRALVEHVSHVRLESFAAARDAVFAAPRVIKRQTDKTRVQFDATSAEIKKAAKILAEPHASASRIGRASLEFVLEQGD